MSAPPTLTVLSLGGGVQSSVMALMAGERAFDRVPDCAIFADTRWEPPSVYEHIEWLAGQLPFPVYVVDNGRSLREDVKALTNHSGSRSYVDIPVYLKGRDGQGDGIGKRQCTTNYKVRPIRRRIRELLGLRPRQRVPAGTTVELWLGISTDEAVRMKDSQDRWMNNRYPLIEAGMSRSDCLQWVVGPPRQAPGTLGRRRLPLPVTPQMGGDQAPVAGAVRRGGGDRRQDAGRLGPGQDAVPAHAQDAPGPCGRPRRGKDGSGRAARRVRERVRGTLWSVKPPRDGLKSTVGSSLRLQFSIEWQQRGAYPRIVAKPSKQV